MMLQPQMVISTKAIVDSPRMFDPEARQMMRKIACGYRQLARWIKRPAA